MNVKDPPPTLRREEILDRTLELVKTGGLANLTMKKVAERVGFTEPAIYRYYPTKQALILGLIDRLEEMLLPRLRSLAADTSMPPVERLERMVSHHAGLIIDTNGLPFLLLAEASAAGDEAVIQRMGRIASGLLENLGRVLGELPLEPGGPPPQTLVLPLLGFAAGLAIQRRLAPERSLAKEEALALIPILVRRITGVGV
ncbi:MAG TPA: TetR/AcrR family transcriptional regulator [Thermoanaerobaculia bacterium]|jgi:AcrR family transcriptional regulator|nr:TetR/AcrR family transcriptional regulator [Thermoanaerobaculia bacterium]